MALGRKPEAGTTETDHDVAVDNSYHPDRLQESEYDPERTREKPRKMSRVVAPILLADSDAESANSVGKQLQLEAENQIKYRTCSWQKVNRTFPLIPNSRRGDIIPCISVLSKDTSEKGSGVDQV